MTSVGIIIITITAVWYMRYIVNDVKRRIKHTEEIGQAAQEAADTADEFYQTAMKSIDTFNYTKRNLKLITSHRRKSSASWAKTGLLFKNK